MTIKTLKVKKLLKGGKYTKKLVGGGNNDTPSQEDLNTYLKYIIDNYNGLLEHQQNKKKKTNKFEVLLNFYTPNKTVNEKIKFNIIINETTKINLFAKEYEPLRHAVALYHYIKNLNKSDNNKKDAENFVNWISSYISMNDYKEARGFAEEIRSDAINKNPFLLQLLDSFLSTETTFNLLKTNSELIGLKTNKNDTLSIATPNSSGYNGQGRQPNGNNGTYEDMTDAIRPQFPLPKNGKGNETSTTYVEMTTPPSLYINIDTFYDNENKPNFNIEATYLNIQKKYENFKDIYICTKKKNTQTI
jgi:hypothetical protein